MKFAILGLNFLLFGLSSMLYFLLFVILSKFTPATVVYLVALVFFLLYIWIFTKIYDQDLTEVKSDSEIILQKIIIAGYFGTCEGFLFIIVLRSLFKNASNHELFAYMVYVIVPITLVGIISTIIFRIQTLGKTFKF